VPSQQMTMFLAIPWSQTLKGPRNLNHVDSTTQSGSNACWQIQNPVTSSKNAKRAPTNSEVPFRLESCLADNRALTAWSRNYYDVQLAIQGQDVLA